jgi:hypothetical protein
MSLEGRKDVAPAGEAHGSILDMTSRSVSELLWWIEELQLLWPFAPLCAPFILAVLVLVWQSRALRDLGSSWGLERNALRWHGRLQYLPAMTLRD